MQDNTVHELDPGRSGPQRKVVVGISAIVVVALAVAIVLLSADSGGAPTIEYTSTDCVYSGPTEFSVGDDMTFTVVNNTDAHGGGGMFRVLPGTPIPDDGAEPPHEGFPWYSAEPVPGESGEFTATITEPGTWMISCGVDDAKATPATPAIDRYAAVIEVLP